MRATGPARFRLPGAATIPAAALVVTAALVAVTLVALVALADGAPALGADRTTGGTNDLTSRPVIAAPATAPAAATPAATPATTPAATAAPDSTGDPSTDLRSSGQGAGAAGNPGGAVWAFLLVVTFGLLCAGGTYVYIRATRSPGADGPEVGTGIGISDKSRDNVGPK